MEEVKVDLGEKSYSIYIDQAFLAEGIRILRTKTAAKRVLVISDETVGAIYGKELLAILQEANFLAELVTVPAGESSKSAEHCMALYTKAIEYGLDRKSLIIALGGGVVGDLAGFVAATLLRGIPFVQIPTTLLAQVDSSVGGKVAINHPLGKNLIGSFYQPQMVLIDTDFFHTLPARELYTGLAEVIKYGVIADSELFAYLEANSRAVLHKDSHAMQHIITHSCRIKARIVEQDECETSVRAILNFGHTIAHAIETATDFTKYNHGEAVAIGMYGAAKLSNYLGLCSQEEVLRVGKLIEKLQLPTAAPDCNARELLPLLSRDKKVVNGKINWILLKQIGEVVITDEVPEELVQRVLSEITE